MEFGDTADWKSALQPGKTEAAQFTFPWWMTAAARTRSWWLRFDSVGVLDRIEIPADVRQEISARLTPGSSLIVAETSVNSAILREGDDFIVWTNDTPMAAAFAPDTQTGAKRAKIGKAKTDQAKARLVGKPRAQTADRAAKRRYDPPAPYGGFWSFRRW